MSEKHQLEKFKCDKCEKFATKETVSHNTSLCLNILFRVESESGRCVRTQ